MADSSHTDDLKSFSFEHRVRRLGARSAPAKPPPQGSRFRRDLVLLGGVITVAALLAPVADVPTPDYPEARAQADSLNAAYRSVWSGDASIEAAARAQGLDVYELPVGQRVVWMMTHPQPTPGGACYGLRTGGGMATVALEFLPIDGCELQQRTVFQGVGRWEDVLPSERMTTVWFVPRARHPRRLRRRDLHGHHLEAATTDRPIAAHRPAQSPRPNRKREPGNRARLDDRAIAAATCSGDWPGCPNEMVAVRVSTTSRAVTAVVC